MLAVDGSFELMQAYLHETRLLYPESELVVACYNCPTNFTLSGSSDAILHLKQKFEADGKAAHLLQTGVAYHSPAMDQVALAYKDHLSDLTRSKKGSKRILMFSSVTGGLLEDPSLLGTPEYWVENMTKPVHFSDALDNLLIQTSKPAARQLGTRAGVSINTLIEVGPHPALRRSIQTIIKKHVKTAVNYLPTLDRRIPSSETLLRSMGELYVGGAPVALGRVNGFSEPPPRTRMSEATMEALRCLPEYQFDHSQRYWYERPISKQTRMRSHGKTELLGVPAATSGSHQAIWRKFFDIAETPWLGDHTIDGKAIYPASGMMVMALEGAKQLASQDRTISEYLMKDAVFTHPILIHPTGRTEVQLSLRPLHNQSERDVSSHDYRVYTRNGDQWLENCRGLVQVKYKSLSSNHGDWCEAYEQDQYYQEQWREASQACQLQMDRSQFYQNLESNGLNFGPSFQCLHIPAWDGETRATANLEPFQWTAKQSQKLPESHVVHPATVDAAGQLGWVSLTEGGTKVLTSGAAVTRIQSAWIAADGAASPEISTLRTCATAKLRGSRGTDVSVFALDGEGKLRFLLSHVETTWVSSAVPGSKDECRHISYYEEFKPDISLLSNQELVEQCAERQDICPMPVKGNQHVDELTLPRLRASLEVTVPQVNSNPGIEKGVSPATNERAEYAVNGVYRPDDSKHADWCTQNTDRPHKSSRAEDEVEKVTKNVLGPGSFRLKSAVDSKNWEEGYGPLLPCLERFPDLLAHKNPSMRVLEIGATSDYIARQVLSSLVRHGHGGKELSRIASHTCTNPSETLLDGHESGRRASSSRLAFKILKIEKDLESQGLVAESYNLIIITLVGLP